jgi:carboxypeptidase Taq
MHPMNDALTAYDHLLHELREASLLGSVKSLLAWDERTKMPHAGAAHRAAQMALISRLAHEKFTSPRIDELLQTVEASDLLADPLSPPAVNIRETRRLYDRRRKLPPSLVEELTRTAALAHAAWVQARSQSDFSIFHPWLDKTIALKQNEANCIGYHDSPYDALLDAFEPGETSRQLTLLFAQLRQPLVDLVAAVVACGRTAPLEILQRNYPIDAQKAFAHSAAERIGFDFSAGRLDITVHPFCSGIGPGDTRLTTRYDGRYFADAFFSVLHEAGHGMYHQGLDPAHAGTPMGEPVSLGIHESQSRLWQINVGHSRAFWQYFFPKAKEAFPEALHDVTPADWHFAINDIRPSLIRTEADDATYNLHILLRMELEQAMITGDLAAADLPAAWNQKMRDYLGLAPPDDAKGCLQDIHWSSGYFGYFPTYTLGNLAAAQLMEQARTDLGDLDAPFARGEFRPLLDWLREKIHRHGKRYKARDLIRHITGKDLSPQPLMTYLRQKTSDLYRV